MTTYDWPQLRDKAINRFHEPPGAALEERVLTHFRETPGRVATLIDSIGKRVDEGKINHGWAILDKELAVVPPEIKATDNSERLKHIKLAETWITNAGGHLDREDELLDAVFGPYGHLYPWRDDQALQTRIVEHWQQHRTRFRKAETEARWRQRSYRETRARIAAATNGAALTPEETELEIDRVTDDVLRRRAAAHDAYLDDLAATVDLTQPAGTLEEHP